MAYVKKCDACYAVLELGGDVCLQIHGSISQQCRRSGRMYYRFITPYPNSKLAFCSPKCFGRWVNDREKSVRWIERKNYPHR